MNLPETFKTYLKTQTVSKATIKNYVMDVNHFLDWLYQKTGIQPQVADQSIFNLFTPEILKEYQADLLTSKTPPSTINRRFSALRKFGQFGLYLGGLTQNPALKVKNITPSTHLGGILGGFQKSLETEKISPLTIKNYLSDLRHFLAWLEAV